MDGDDEEDGSDATNHKGNNRKKGVAWTEEEHKQFLNGLAKLGKGNWRGISRHFVQTKSPTQVASHAQKYFIRQTVAGKRKRRSSLFDLVPENEVARETENASQATADTTAGLPAKTKLRSERPLGPPAPAPAIPALQGPEALAWAYWYQTMMLQQNPLWMASVQSYMEAPGMPGKLEPPQAQCILAPGQPPSGPLAGLSAPPMLPPLGANVPAALNPALAAYLAQQGQMTAILALNCMPQMTPEYLAKYAAGLQIHAQAAQAAQQAAQTAISSKQDKEETCFADDNLSAMEEDPSQTPDEDEESKLKCPRSSKNASRFDLSNVSTSTEEFGNGALVKPKAQKVRSYMDLPNFLQDRKDGGSLLNSNSKQSQSTQFAGPSSTTWVNRNLPLDAQALSNFEPRTADSASNAVEGTVSDTPSAAMDPDLATSHYKAGSEASKYLPFLGMRSEV